MKNPWETPVYNAQCRSWSIAKQLTGVQSDAVKYYTLGKEIADGSPLFLFRALREYRSDGANALRRQVAQVIRKERAGYTVTPGPWSMDVLS